MKKSLEDLPRYIAVDAWNDFLSWLKDYQKVSGVDKTASIPFIEARFGVTLAAATRLADDRRQIEELSGDAHKLSLHLASKLKQLDELHFKRETAQPGTNLERLDAEIEVAKYNARALEAIVKEKEKEAQVADGADEIADNADFIPLDEPVASSNVRSWPEDNYEDFATKRATALESLIPTSKLPSASLLVKQKTPAGCKTLMPCPLELFSATEIDEITPSQSSLDGVITTRTRWNLPSAGRRRSSRRCTRSLASTSWLPGWHRSARSSEIASFPRSKLSWQKDGRWTWCSDICALAWTGCWLPSRISPMSLKRF